MPQVIQLDGVVEPVNQGTVAAQTSGRVIGVFVDVNDHVTQGQVLLEISDVQQSASLTPRRRNWRVRWHKTAKHRLRSTAIASCFPKARSRAIKWIPPKRARSAAASVKSAQAAVAQAKESLGYTNITAPYAGVVTQRHVELGETVAPGTPLISGFSLENSELKPTFPSVIRIK